MMVDRAGNLWSRCWAEVSSPRCGTSLMPSPLLVRMHSLLGKLLPALSLCIWTLRGSLRHSAGPAPIFGVLPAPAFARATLCPPVFVLLSCCFIRPGVSSPRCGTSPSATRISRLSGPHVSCPSASTHYWPFLAHYAVGPLLRPSSPSTQSAPNTTANLDSNDTRATTQLRLSSNATRRFPFHFPQYARWVSSPDAQQQRARAGLAQWCSTTPLCQILDEERSDQCSVCSLRFGVQICRQCSFLSSRRCSRFVGAVSCRLVGAVVLSGRCASVRRGHGLPSVGAASLSRA